MSPTRWLGWLIPASEREFVLGDLEEAHGHRSAARRAWELAKAAWVCRRHRPRHIYYSLITSSRGDPLVTTLLNDLRYGLRQLLVRPGFTALSVLTLALGIGATTAIFSVVNPILFESLPYPNPDRVVRVSEVDKDGVPNGTGFATFVDLKAMSTSFEALAVNSQWQPTLQSNGEPERLSGQRVPGISSPCSGCRPLWGGTSPRRRTFAAAPRGHAVGRTLAPPIRERPRGRRETGDLRWDRVPGGRRHAPDFREPDFPFRPALGTSGIRGLPALGLPHLSSPR